MRTSGTAAAFLLASAATAPAGEPAWPPALPDGKSVATHRDAALLEPTAPLREGVRVAKAPPTIDFLYSPGQDYPGTPWSVWGDGLVADGVYYSSIGDHKAPQGNALVCAYDPAKKSIRALLNTPDVLALPEGHYLPGKIHSRIDLGSDGCLYFSTHRGSTRVTTDEYHYKGDWILRHRLATGKTEIVARGPVPKHCIPTSVLDPERLIFYGGTAAGDRTDKTVMFFAYDVRKKTVLHTAPDGPYRCLIFAPSTGRVYYCSKDEEPLMRYDPADGKPPQPIDARLGLRAATRETPDGAVYTVSTKGEAALWRFDTKAETARRIGTAPVATRTYITSLDADPAGRYLYYMPGAHGRAEEDGTPVVQFDTRTGTKKVVAFLHPFLHKRYGYVPVGAFGSAVSADGGTVFISLNGNRGGKDRKGRYAFDTCALVAVHVPEEERP